MFRFRAVICALLFLCYFNNAQLETTTMLPEEFSESVTTEMAVSQTTTESTTTKSPPTERVTATKSPPTERVTATNLKNSIPTLAPNSKTTSSGRTAEARIPSNVLFSPARAIEALANPADLENVVNDGKTNKEVRKSSPEIEVSAYSELLRTHTQITQMQATHTHTQDQSTHTYSLFL